VAEEGIEVRIISRTETTQYPRLRTPVRVKHIVYRAQGMPLRSIFIPVEEWSLEREKELIKQDIERFKALAPEVYRV